MRRDEWIQSLLIMATVALVVVGAVWLLMPPRDTSWDEPGDMLPRRNAPKQVTLWVGEVEPGLKGVLTAVFGDPEPDSAHDRKLNEALGRVEGAAAPPLAFYRLLLFNTSKIEKRFPLSDGALVVKPAEGAVVGLQNLSEGDLAEDPEISPSVRATLAMLGTLRADVEVPAGKRVNLVVAFAGRADLATADSVETAEGRPFHRLQRTRAELRRIIADPRVDRIRDL